MTTQLWDMGQDADYECRDALIDYLARQMIRKQLCIVLGAGASVDFGLPSWPELLKRLWSRCRRSPFPKSTRLEAVAEHIRSSPTMAKKPGAFLDIVHDTMYRNTDVSFERLRKNAFLSALGATVMASQRGSVVNVITFNYDNLVEIYLRYHGYYVESVTDERAWNPSGDVAIFHPHGYLPYDSKDEFSEDIVLDQHSYSMIVGKDGNIWRQRISTILRTHTCIFIGLSGDDQNLDSLLVEAQSTHSYTRGNARYWGVSFLRDRQKSKIAEERWKKRRIYPQYVGNYSRDIPEFLFAVCQKAANLRRA